MKKYDGKIDRETSRWLVSKENLKNVIEEFCKIGYICCEKNLPQGKKLKNKVTI